MSTGIRSDEESELRGIENRLKELENREHLATQPGIADLISWCRRNVLALNEQLSTDRELQGASREHERLAMMDKKDVLLYLIALFDPARDLAALESELAARAEIFEDYQKNR